MSQFDFPRINFFGKTKINVGTCNNDDFKPDSLRKTCGILVNDLVSAQAFAPPRVYLTAAVKAAIEKAHKSGDPGVPAYNFVAAGDSQGTEYYYVVIEAVSTPEIFVAWSQLPLGQYGADSEYEFLYEKTQLKGTVPAEWNYNGGMQNAIEDCTVVSVAVKPSDNSGENLFLASDPGNCPADLTSFLGATFNAVKDSKKGTTAVLCDLNPSQPYSTQYFVDGFYLREADSSDTLMAGRPVKGVTRWINFGRVVNIPGSPMIASGGVFQAIPAEAMTEWSTLKAAFEAHGDGSKKLIGAFVRYNLFEVYEDRNPVYADLPKYGTNPAYMSVMGSITPWYEGDMATASTGRLLNPTANTPNTKQALAPITFSLDTESSLISLDLFNTLPENRDPAGDFDPYTNGNNPPPMSYTLSKIGALDVKVSGNTLARINIDGTNYTRQDLINNGGMFDFIYGGGAASDTLNSSDFSIWGDDVAGQYVQMMAESRYSIQSDQSCAYANAGGPNNSFLSQGTTYGPTVLRVLDRGVPVEQANAVNVTQTVFGLDFIFNLKQLSQDSLSVYDGLEVSMDTSSENILVYVYTPPGGTLPTTGFSGTTEFYLNLRVLPDQSAQYAGYYLQPGQPGYKKLDWTALFNEIFFTYYMLYPAMTQVSSLKDPNNWNNPGAAKALKSYTSQDNWDGYLYMPRSRDLSDADRKLIDTWADGVINS